MKGYDWQQNMGILYAEGIVKAIEWSEFSDRTLQEE